MTDATETQPAPTAQAVESYSAGEAAVVLTCSKKSVQNMAHAGLLPHYRVGASKRAGFRFPKAAVDAYALGRCPWAAVGQPKPEGVTRGS